MCSIIIEIKTKIKQTTATAHVGVSSRDLPPAAAAICFSEFALQF